jgi:hypothetical protein
MAETGTSCVLVIGIDPHAAIHLGIDHQIAEKLSAREYACVVIGGGIRKPEPMLEFFETVINLVRRHAPNAAIAFNTNPENSLDAALRWRDSEFD